MSEAPPGGWPRLTILTPCFNAAQTIAEAVESVRQQRYENLEHIIVDAASKDGTLAALRPFPELRVVSESDKGSHDAMNKGIGLASGDIIGFLNADDYYAEGTLTTVARAFVDDATLDVVVVGTVVFEDTSAGGRRILVARDHAEESGFSLCELAFGAPGFNGRFFRRSLLDRLGGFDLGYDFSADRHFLLRAALSGAKSVTLPRFGYFFRSHPGSRTLNAARQNAEAFAREHLQQAAEFARLAHTPKQRHAFLAWHAFEGAKIVYIEIKRGLIAAAIIGLCRLTLYDPLWPLRLPLAFMYRRRVRKAERHATSRMIFLAENDEAPESHRQFSHAR